MYTIALYVTYLCCVFTTYYSNSSTSLNNGASVIKDFLYKSSTSYIVLHSYLLIQYSQRGTFIWTPITASNINVFAESDHRDRWFLPICRVVAGVQLPTAVNTARRGVRTPRITMAGHGGPWWLNAYFTQFTSTLCIRWKTVDRGDPSRATTANPRVRSSRNARVMTTRVNGCSTAVFDRAWIILTTGVRGFMKVPRWLYCTRVLLTTPRHSVITYV